MKIRLKQYYIESIKKFSEKVSIVEFIINFSNSFQYALFMLPSSFFIPDLGPAVLELQKDLGELSTAPGTQPGSRDSLQM